MKTWSNIVSRRSRVRLRSKIFADFSLQDFAMDAFTVNEELVQISAVLPWWCRSFSFNADGLSLELAASPVASATVTIFSVTVATSHGRHGLAME